MTETSTTIHKTGPAVDAPRDVIFKITLILEAPILTRATEATPGLSDAAARDHRRRLYLAGTLIKGRLRESLLEIGQHLPVTEDEINQFFGAESPKGRGDAPHRGCFHFSDFITLAHPDPQVGIRIRIDQKRNAVSQGALAFLELPFAPRKEVEFTGTIRTRAKNRAEQQRFKEILTTGLRWIPAFGGQQGIGFGRPISVVVTARPRCFPLPRAIPADRDCPQYLHLSLIPQSPFCLSGHIPLTNRFEADEIISGAVLKGVIAHTLNRIAGRDVNEPIDDQLPEPWQLLGKHFSRLRFTHAFPVQDIKDGQPAPPAARPVQPPLTTVTAGGNIFDIALKPGPGLISGEAPAFAADWKWKTYQAVRTRFNWPDDPVRKLRVRTGIDTQQKRAEDNTLFAMELLVPDGHEWLARVDLCFDGRENIPESNRRLIAGQLQALLDYGLVGLGKTKVEVSVRTSPAPMPDKTSIAPLPMRVNDKTLPVWVVTLQTEALVLDPRELAGPEKSTAHTLWQQYQYYWTTVSPKIQLHKFYAAQSLRGRYLTRRFSVARPDAPYNTFLLTRPGSVFLLTTSEEDVDDTGRLLAKLQAHGLPLPQKWPGELYGTSASTAPTWRQCPWLPENGFGEIAVNLACHTKSCPGWEDI